MGGAPDDRPCVDIDLRPAHRSLRRHLDAPILLDDHRAEPRRPRDHRVGALAAARRAAEAHPGRRLRWRDRHHRVRPDPSAVRRGRITSVRSDRHLRHPHHRRGHVVVGDVDDGLALPPLQRGDVRHHVCRRRRATPLALGRRLGRDARDRGVPHAVQGPLRARRPARRRRDRVRGPLPLRLAARQVRAAPRQHRSGPAGDVPIPERHRARTRGVRHPPVAAAVAPVRRAEGGGPARRRRRKAGAARRRR